MQHRVASAILNVRRCAILQQQFDALGVTHARSEGQRGLADVANLCGRPLLQLVIHEEKPRDTPGQARVDLSLIHI